MNPRGFNAIARMLDERTNSPESASTKLTRFLIGNPRQAFRCAVPVAIAEVS